MSDLEQHQTNAELIPLRKISWIWLIPIVALFIGGWMVFYSWYSQGSLITITFESAEGVEVGVTKIKLHEISIGTVVETHLNKSKDGIIVTARMDKDTDTLLVEDSLFWVVKPRVGRGGVSGLSTILSGAYIELESGTSDKHNAHFVGLESPPVTPAGTPGLHITLDSNGQKALDIGDPILFRGIQVGQIEYVHLNTDEREVYYNAFIESPYDKLISTNTRFWEINGVSIDVTSAGVHIESGTLETMLGGGITFDVPAYLPRGEILTERGYFTIYASKNEIEAKQFKVSQKFILLFADSIRGLALGAPVEYKGVKIGRVIRTDIDYPQVGSLLDKSTLIPIMISIEPARMGLSDSEEQAKKIRAEISQWVSSGLHGFLANGNLLSGGKFIELKYFEQTQDKLQNFADWQVIPTQSSEFSRVLTSFAAVADKIKALPLGKVANNAASALSEMDKAMIKFSAASANFDSTLSSVENQKLISKMNKTLSSIQNLANSFSEGSQTHQDIQETISALEKVLQELAPVLSQINRQPNALIFNGERNENIQPTKSPNLKSEGN